MSILETIRSRRSIREYTDQPIPDDSIDALVEAIRWAPSAGNLQSRKFYFVFNGGLKRRLAETVGNPGLASRIKTHIKNMLNRNYVTRAPLVVVACLDRTISKRYGKRGEHLYAIQDASASVMNLLLTAHELGLGSVWIGGFKEDAVAEIIQLPENERPVALIPVGFPARIPAAKTRMTKEEAVRFLR